MSVCVVGTILNILPMGSVAMGYGELCLSHLKLPLVGCLPFILFYMGVYQDEAAGSGENKSFWLFIASHQFCMVLVALPQPGLIVMLLRSPQQ